ncbi:hypothetical protein PV733_28200 [Streptomyces europaeiscabiei]|uniref:hypothetical protein n=1 Tax=Streptomyces europaeiscabiei TaxID=146819 RepID=UPI0029A1AC05|nr:hypothetical protein [Streptomyces europaeiscabiei]MDX3712753.1 hypothetical protein [Streptomyces europaeiscabiei]
MSKVPDPPNYPPYSSGPAWTEPEVHIHFTTEEAEGSRWDFSWVQPGKNLGAIACAWIPANIVAATLNDVEREQSASGAWVMGGFFLTVAGIRFVQHRGFFNRFLIWTGVLGLVLALPVFTAVVDVMTGGGR